MAHLGVVRDTVYRSIDQKRLPAHGAGKSPLRANPGLLRPGGPANARRSSKAGVRPSSWIYTTRLQKGGALLDDMRQRVRTSREA
jgi:hypothetical protein